MKDFKVAHKDFLSQDPYNDAFIATSVSSFGFGEVSANIKLFDGEKLADLYIQTDFDASEESVQNARESLRNLKDAIALLQLEFEDAVNSKRLYEASDEAAADRERIKKRMAKRWGDDEPEVIE